jgi:hypothetical protein
MPTTTARGAHVQYRIDETEPVHTYRFAQIAALGQRLPWYVIIHHPEWTAEAQRHARQTLERY